MLRVFPRGRRFGAATVCTVPVSVGRWRSQRFCAMYVNTTRLLVTGLCYVQTNDKCGIFTRTPMEWEAGKGFMGGSFRPAPDEPAQQTP